MASRHCFDIFWLKSLSISLVEDQAKTYGREGMIFCILHSISIIMLYSKNQGFASLFWHILAEVIIDKPSTRLVEAQAKTYGREGLIFCILHSLSIILLYSKNQGFASLFWHILAEVIIDKPTISLVEAQAKTYGREALIFCILHFLSIIMLYSKNQGFASLFWHILTEVIIDKSSWSSS